MGDDIAYAFYAHYVSQGTFMENIGGILSIRLLQIYPIGFFYYLFGAGILSSAAWDIISYVLSVFLVFLIGRELYDKYVGLLASFLLAIFPLVAIYSVTMSDNIPMMLFVLLAFFCLIKALKKNSRAWYFVTGIVLFAAPLTIPEGFVLWIIVGLLLIIGLFFKMPINEKRIKVSINTTTIFIVIGFLLALVVTMLFNYYNSKIALITFTANILYYSQTWRPDLLPLPVNVALAFYPGVMFPYNFYSAIFNQHNPNIPLIIQSIDLSGGNSTGLFFYAFIPCALYLLATRERRKSYMLLFWFMAGLLYLEFGPQHVGLSPFVYVLSHRLDRYLTLISGPLAIIISAAAIRLVRGSRKRWRLTKLALCSSAILILTVTSWQIIFSFHQANVASRFSQYEAAKYILGVPNNTRVYLDSGYGDMVVFTNFDNLSRFYFGYGGVSSCYEIPGGSLVLVQRQFIDFEPCPFWSLVLEPNLTNYSSNIRGRANIDLTNLYSVPGNYIAPINSSTNMTS